MLKLLLYTYVIGVTMLTVASMFVCELTDVCPLVGYEKGSWSIFKD